MNILDKKSHIYSHTIFHMFETSHNPLPLLPDEIHVMIFSQLNVLSLSNTCKVCREWKRIADSSNIWKHIIYRDIAFGNSKWTQYFGKDVVKAEDYKEEFSSFPQNIVEEYRKFQLAFPEKQALTSLILVRIPKTLNGKLTLDNLDNLITRLPDLCASIGYRYNGTEICNILKKLSIDSSRWVLMTNHILSESLNKNLEFQNQIITNISKTYLNGYNLPDLIEVIPCMLSHYLTFQTPLFSNTFIFCKEITSRAVTVVGDFDKMGPDIFIDPINPIKVNTGIALLKRL